ncbi:MAG: methyltransferase domain-containing protein [Pyrinomonadaceae bacterium]
MIEEGRQRGVQNIYPGSLAEIRKELVGARADLVYLHHVFEHIDDPLLFLKDCRGILAPRGKIVIVVPDVSKIDAYANPAGDLLQFLHIAHKYNFTFAGLQRLCQRVGYIAAKLFPAPELQTSWSVMPELWVQMTPHENHPTSITADGLVRARAGARVLSYLRKTERLHKLGLCKGQLLMKMLAQRNQLRTKLRRIKLRFGCREKV